MVALHIFDDEKLDAAASRLLEAYQAALPFYEPITGTEAELRDHKTRGRRADVYLLQCAQRLGHQMSRSLKRSVPVTETAVRKRA